MFIDKGHGIERTFPTWSVCLSYCCSVRPFRRHSPAGVNMDSTAAAGGSCTFPDFIFVFVRNKLTISRSKTLPSSKSRFVENIWTDFNLRIVLFNYFSRPPCEFHNVRQNRLSRRPVTCSRLVVHDKQIAEVSPACMHWPQNNNKVHGSI